MRLFGTILPQVQMVVGPCDEHGIPAVGDEDASGAMWECKALMLAWFGQAMLFGLGGVQPRAVDPANPRRYLSGNL